MYITNVAIQTTPFKSNNIGQQEMSTKKNRYLEKSLLGFAAIGISLAIAAPYTTKNIFKGLKANGLEIKNGVIISSKTGEKFTGTIKYNSKPFGLQKESVTYLDGKTTEIVHHSFTGKEVNGLFFKDGKPFMRVGNIVRNKKQQFYPCYEYDIKGDVARVLDCFAEPKTSVFDTIRKVINK